MCVDYTSKMQLLKNREESLSSYINIKVGWFLLKNNKLYKIYQPQHLILFTIVIYKMELKFA